MLTTRLLPSEEWPRLKGTEAETVWPHLVPERTSIVVVEHDGVIVGCHVLSWLLHAECLWIAEAHRGKSSVQRRLWTTVQRIARDEWQVPSFVTGAVDDRVRNLLAHVGAKKLPGDQYVVSVKGTGPCLQS